MIDAKELRIGNLVLVDSDATSVHQICKNSEKGKNQNLGVRFFTNEYSGWIDCTSGHIDPIPLTEDWLVKLGFEITNEIKDVKECETCRVLSIEVPHELISNRKLYFLNCYGEENPIWELDLFDDFSDGHYSKCLWLADVKHVHQLQNLYYALTGKELTIKQ